MLLALCQTADRVSNQHLDSQKHDISLVETTELKGHELKQLQVAYVAWVKKKKFWIDSYLKLGWLVV